jgi:hypothetical protein
MKHRHGTPFEHNMFRFHVKSPIFCNREWFRHRIGSFNEESSRYSRQLGAVVTCARCRYRYRVLDTGRWDLDIVDTRWISKRLLAFDAASPSLASTVTSELSGFQLRDQHPPPRSLSSPARERALQFFEPLIDFRPACLLAGDLRCSLRLLRLEPLDFGRRTRQVLLDDRQLALNR